MLVDARWPPPEPEPQRSPFPWALVVWPVLTVVFLAVGHFVPPIPTFACSIAALYCAFESFARLLPRTCGGLKDYQQ
jgi:hypothetical protein